MTVNHARFSWLHALSCAKVEAGQHTQYEGLEPGCIALCSLQFLLPETLLII